MTDLTTILRQLKRPRILVGAARKGLALYRREQDLRRILARDASTREAGRALLETEERLEERRRAGDAGYSVADHISVLTALIAEAALVPARG